MKATEHPNPPNGSAPGVHFSSLTNEWATPQAFFDAQHAVHNFTLDVASTDENAKCAKHYTQSDDGLKRDWSKDRCWMNPPYGREIGRWMRKAYEESQRGALVVCLVPARTDTAWWHDYAVKGEITLLRGRLKFVGEKVNPNTHTPSAPFPSAVVVFRPKSANSVTRYHFQSVRGPLTNWTSQDWKNLCDEVDDLRAALIKILNLCQETCATHEDQCIAATQIAQKTLANSNLQPCALSLL